MCKATPAGAIPSTAGSLRLGRQFAWLADAFAFLLGGRIAQFLTCLFGKSRQPGHHVGVRGGHVGLLAGIALQVVQDLARSWRGCSRRLAIVSRRLGQGIEGVRGSAASSGRCARLAARGSSKSSRPRAASGRSARRAARARCRGRRSACAGNSAPASLASVGRMSMVMAGSRQTLPAGIFPGQRAMNGSRTPPSQTSCLCPRAGRPPSRA